MNRKIRESGLVEDALDAVHQATGLKAEVVPRTPFPDAGVRIVKDGTKIVFPVAVKPALTNAAIGVMAQTYGHTNRRTLLVTGYVAPAMADRLKELDIPFIDAAGNAYINEPRLLIFIKGNKKPDKYKAAETGKTFKPAGIKVVFALLCNPGLEKRPYRDIAEQADVALGTVAAVMRDLEGRNLLLDMGGKGRRLTDKKDLLTRWVTAYPEQLRPKLRLGRFRAPAGNWWEDAVFNNQAYFGGEVAAHFITKYLKPQVVTIYAFQPLGPLLLQNKLKQAADGDIEILQVFWNFTCDRDRPGLVHPILVYADLIAAGDERNIETARMIYEKELHRFVGPD